MAYMYLVSVAFMIALYSGSDGNQQKMVVNIIWGFCFVDMGLTLMTSLKLCCYALLYVIDALQKVVPSHDHITQSTTRKLMTLAQRKKNGGLRIGKK